MVGEYPMNCQCFFPSVGPELQPGVSGTSIPSTAPPGASSFFAAPPKKPGGLGGNRATHFKRVWNIKKGGISRVLTTWFMWYSSRF